MARLENKSIVLSTAEDSKTQSREEMEKFAALLARSRALPPGEVVGALLSWPRGDGKAWYLVTKAKPLTLAHLSIGDNWQIEEALIRGLRLIDVLRMVERARLFASLLQRKED